MYLNHTTDACQANLRVYINNRHCMRTPLNHAHRTATVRASHIILHYNAMNIIIVLINWLFKNTMRAGDQKLMIDLEWPKCVPGLY